MSINRSDQALRHDLVISPFGASAAEIVDVARCAEDSGFHGVWTYDHLTGTMLDRGSSHDPFVLLGAIAAATTHVRIGPLVANMMNRHPARLAVAMSSLQSLSAGRAVLGIGAGAAPGTQFAGEHKTIGTQLLDGPSRSRRLIESILIVRHIWEGAGEFRGEFFKVEQPGLGLDLEESPPIIVGASGPRTVKLALDHADGVNLVDGPRLPELLSIVETERRDRAFETSIHVPIVLDHPLGGPISNGDFQRRVLAHKAPFDLNALAKIGARLHG